MPEAAMPKQSPPPMGEAANVADALATRRSVRAYRNETVARETIEKILTLAAHAPSGSNHQPWQVYVLTGASLKRVGDAIKGAYLAEEAGHKRDYTYYTEPLFEPYLARRRACGWGLYGTLGITRGEKERMKEQRSTNYNFFGAPAGLIFTIDRKLETGSYIDYGGFLQGVMVAARAFGLHTCAQAAIGEYPDIVRRELKLPGDHLVLCGMAMGYADPDALVNSFTPEREPVSAFANFLD